MLTASFKPSVDMPCVRIGFFLVFLTASCLGKTIVPRQVEPQREKDTSHLEAGRRKVSAFGQPGLPGNFPIAPPENDLERKPVPDDDLEETSDDDDESSEGRRIPDEGFFAGRQFQNEDGRKGDLGETDVDDIPEIDNDIDKGKGQDLGNIPAEIFIEINEESERKDATGEDPPKEEGENQEEEEEGRDVAPGDEEYEGAADTAEENHRDPDGSIFNHPFFVFRRLLKYFTMFENIFEGLFRRAVDELPLLNGTYANTTEEDVAIDGRLFHAISTLIKDRAHNNTLYVETLSSLPGSNETQVSKEENL